MNPTSAPVRRRGVPDGPAALGLLACLAVLAGCRAAPPRLAPPEPAPGLDPTAEQLHDVCGSILLFHGAHRRMPLSLEELCEVTGLDRRRTVDPSTGQAFAYAADGFATSEAGAVVLLARPAEGRDTCWAVAVARAGAALAARVVLLPASAFEAAAPERTDAPWKGPQPDGNAPQPKDAKDR